MKDILDDLPRELVQVFVAYIYKREGLYKKRRTLSHRAVCRGFVWPEFAPFSDRIWRMWDRRAEIGVRGTQIGLRGGQMGKN